MAQIGSFTKNSDGSYTGDIITLSVQAQNVRIVPEADRPNESAPSYRITVGRAEIGAGWAKQSTGGRCYIGIKLDDPSFAAPIFANLFDDDQGHTATLIWSRQTRRGR